MDEIILKEAKLNDRGQLDTLFREELKFHKNLMPDIFKIPEHVVEETWLQSIIDNENSFLIVSECNEKIVGAVFYNIYNNPEDKIYQKRKFGYIEELIVNEQFRGQGIGKKLLEYAIEDLRKKDIRDIELNVWDNNEVGHNFFKKLGFNTIQRRMKLRN
jgi:ribosomal protein S18 acetylase RimI-like enzyme